MNRPRGTTPPQRHGRRLGSGALLAVASTAVALPLTILPPVPGLRLPALLGLLLLGIPTLRLAGREGFGCAAERARA
jgi:hypothetical protein